MARKKKHEEHENLERWLVSYADFITLLFAFFVVMYSISSVNEGKYRVLSDTLVSAFRENPTTDRMVQLQTRQAEILQGQGQPIGHSTPQPVKVKTEHVERAERMKRVAKSVLEAMQPLIKDGQVRVTQSAKGVTVEINASILFTSGEAVLQPASTETLAAVAQVLAQTDNAVQVEGHTDNVPIRSPIFPSNWELSSARAGSVVRLFVEMGVPPERMQAIGYADNRPLDTNATLDGRARNRRVNVLILNETPMQEREIAVGGTGEPVTEEPAAPTQ